MVRNFSPVTSPRAPLFTAPRPLADVIRKQIRTSVEYSICGGWGSILGGTVEFKLHQYQSKHELFLVLHTLDVAIFLNTYYEKFVKNFGVRLNSIHFFHAIK